MTRKDVRVKRSSCVNAGFVLDPVWPPSDRLAEPIPPPILMRLPTASLCSGQKPRPAAFKPRAQNRFAAGKSQQNQVCVNDVSS
ncbi:hypothetical protein, partial [Mesorhizobium sp. M1A.F.Ca.IN.020.06.1.1]|uniref:hypothetical protein n=1 Tax=Mesorhizobium sp. M1A.F.Ca.IN.020.06.1.1 TaxID=2496765 RepID=UPI0019D43318